MGRRAKNKDAQPDASKEIAPQNEEAFVDYESQPLHELASIAKKKGFAVRAAHKKEHLLAMIETGIDPLKKVRTVKRAPVLKEKPKNINAVLPDEILPRLEQLKQQGLQWVICEKTCSVEFRLPTGQYDIEIDPATNRPVVDPETRSHLRKPLMFTACANLNQSARNIMNTALSVFPKSAPVEMGRGQEHKILG